MLFYLTAHVLKFIARRQAAVGLFNCDSLVPSKSVIHCAHLSFDRKSGHHFLHFVQLLLLNLALCHHLFASILKFLSDLSQLRPIVEQ